MKAALLPPALFAILLAAPGLLAGDGKLVTITDVSAAVQQMAIVWDYDGLLLPEPAGDSAIAQLPGWPVTMPIDGNFLPTRGAVLADLTRDGKLEIIAASTAGQVYAWDYTGQPLPGFPVSTIGLAQYAPAVDDLDGDGDLEIVQFTRGWTEGGRLYILDHTGRVLPGFPVSVNNNNLSSSPTLYDLDKDGKLEIVVGERAWPIGYIRIFEMDGTEWGGKWPVALDHVPAASASVGDVDQDGVPEIFYVSYNTMYLVRPDGSAVPGWPRQIPGTNFSYQSAALADLNHDGDLEIVVGTHRPDGACHALNHDGTELPGWPKGLGTWTYCPPTVTDLEGDGKLEILDGRAGGFGGYSDCFWAWDVAGNVKPGFPYGMAHGGGSEGPLTVADINSDGRMEIFADHNITQGGIGWLFGVDFNGKDLPGFPLRPEGVTYMNGATIGDVDGDGDYELCVISCSGTTANVNLYDLPDSFRTTRGDWKTYHGRNRRGGLYPAALVGDLNCDGVVNNFDIDPFVLALTDPAEYAKRFPRCDRMLADCNGDGVVDNFDIDPFVKLLTP